MVVIERNITVHRAGRNRNQFVLFQKTIKNRRIQCECVSIPEAKKLKNYVIDLICTYDDPDEIKAIADEYIDKEIKPSLVLERCHLNI